MKTYPLKFRPIYKYRIWGGQKLREFFGKDIPQDQKIGESWELADLPEDKTEVTNGPLAGQSIDKILSQYPEQITGKADYKPPFPLLIKILDAQDVLSVQVHPDEGTCRRRGKGDPKTECWYIIDSVPGAVIYKGLKPGVTREQFAKAIENGTVAELLKKVPVEPGECHFLPAGAAHAIGEGLLIAEIQTPSDTTYRVFDWNRVDQDGNARQLHIEDALESINFQMSEKDLTVKSQGRLVDAKEFKVDKYTFEKGEKFGIELGSMKTIVIVAGSGHFDDENEENTDFKAGDTILLPAEYSGSMAFFENCDLMLITV